MEACWLRGLRHILPHEDLPVPAGHRAHTKREHVKSFRVRCHHSLHRNLSHLYSDRLQHGRAGVNPGAAYDHRRHASLPRRGTTSLGYASDAAELVHADQVLQDAPRNLPALPGTLDMSLAATSLFMAVSRGNACSIKTRKEQIYFIISARKNLLQIFHWLNTSYSS